MSDDDRKLTVQSKLANNVCFVWKLFGFFNIYLGLFLSLILYVFFFSFFTSRSQNIRALGTVK